MKITKIEKKKRLYLLEIDNDDCLYVTEDTIVHFMLSKDKNITAETLKKIKVFAQFSYGKNLALYYLSFKQRTEKEVRDYLIKHEIEGSTSSKIIQQLKAENWLDDDHYTDSFLQQNLRTGDKGPYLLQQKLKQKGIATATIDSHLENLDFSPVATRVAEKLFRKYADRLPSKALKDKMTEGLINKGFSYQEAKQALIDFDFDRTTENDQDLIYKELDKQYRKYQRKYDGYELRQHLMQALARKGFDFDDIKSSLREYL